MLRDVAANLTPLSAIRSVAAAAVAVAVAAVYAAGVEFASSVIARTTD